MVDLVAPFILSALVLHCLVVHWRGWCASGFVRVVVGVLLVDLWWKRAIFVKLLTFLLFFFCYFLLDVQLFFTKLFLNSYLLLLLNLAKLLLVLQILFVCKLIFIFHVQIKSCLILSSAIVSRVRILHFKICHIFFYFLIYFTILLNFFILFQRLIKFVFLSVHPHRRIS